MKIIKEELILSYFSIRRKNPNVYWYILLIFPNRTSLTLLTATKSVLLLLVSLSHPLSFINMKHVMKFMFEQLEIMQIR